MNLLYKVGIDLIPELLKIEYLCIIYWKYENKKE